MKRIKDDIFITTTIASILAAGLSTVSTVASADSEPKLEKCYGIVKKGMNDCPGNQHPCAGLSGNDGDPDEWIYVLEGTCHKILGGRVKPDAPLSPEMQEKMKEYQAHPEEFKNKMKEDKAKEKK